MIGRDYVASGPLPRRPQQHQGADSSYAAVSDEEIDAGDIVKVVAIEDSRPKVVKARQA
jgi:membrane protein implicated in regulation of membrane protease activity